MVRADSRGLKKSVISLSLKQFFPPYSHIFNHVQGEPASWSVSHHIWSSSDPAPWSGSRRPGHAPLLSGRCALVVLSCLEVLDGFSVLVINQGQGDLRVPAGLLRGVPEVDLFVIFGNDGEIHELFGALHTVHLLYGLQLEFFDLGALYVRVHIEAVLGQDARLFLPELEEAVAPLLQVSLLDDFLRWHFHCFFCQKKRVGGALLLCVFVRRLRRRSFSADIVVIQNVAVNEIASPGFYSLNPSLLTSAAVWECSCQRSNSRLSVGGSCGACRWGRKWT